MPVGLFRIIRRQKQHHLGLDGIGVLEFVDQQVRETIAEVFANLGLVAEQSRRLQQKILVIQPAQVAPQFSVCLHGVLEHTHDDGIPPMTPFFDQRLGMLLDELLPAFLFSFSLHLAF